jgi:hypothetical protein
VGVTTEPPYTNKSQGVAPRNGTNTHVINFTTDGDAPFTPTNGRMLVFVIYGAVTHTVSAGSWTEQLQPVSSGELSIFTVTAASHTSISVLHNGSNYPAPWCILEIPAGSTYTSGIGSSPTADTFPALTGLPGTAQLIIGARGRTSSQVQETGASSVWTAPWVEDADQVELFGVTDGGYLTVGHQINVTATSITPAATTTYSATTFWLTNDRQHAVFAINAVAPGPTTTPFTKDYSVPWRVLGAFTQDVSVPWRVLAAFTKDTSIPWRVLAGFTKDYGIPWQVYALFTKDVAIPWRVLGSFTKDTSIPWRVLGSFTKDVSVPWRVLNSWSADTALNWRVLGSFTKDTALFWDVMSGTSFQKDYALPWRVLGSFTADTAVPWRVLNGWQKDADLRWRVLGGFTKDTGLLWDVLADTAFARSYGLLWNVRAMFSADTLLRWRVLTDALPTLLPADVVVYLEDDVTVILYPDTVTAYLG